MSKWKHFFYSMLMFILVFMAVSYRASKKRQAIDKNPIYVVDVIRSLDAY